jgi:hypothetical protein
VSADAPPKIPIGLSVEDLTKALEQEDRQRIEIVAWRNRFPQYIFDRSTALIVERPDTEKS